jgi:glycosyltransferase involved in cell wall biosynthesis
LDILFIHPNFPGQFRRIAAGMAALSGMRVYGLGDAQWMEQVDLAGLEAVNLLRYPSPEPVGEGVHRYNRPMEAAIRRAEAVRNHLFAQKCQGFEPEAIIVHPGWGDGFFLKELFPATPIIGYFEYFYRPRGADVGFDPEFPLHLDDLFRLRALNAVQLLAFDACDHRLTPTQWQRSCFPPYLQPHLEVVHEGVDTDLVRPDPNAVVTLPDGATLCHGDEVLTFVSRSLEPYRGYHQFMRALPAILAERPNCQVVIVGDHGVSYGRRLAEGEESYQQRYWNEVKDRVDAARIHFTGTLPYATYLKVLQVSRVHVYLTYPFILSWSLLEAMAAGCCIVASDTAPVREVIDHGETGMLVPFFDTEALARQVVALLADPEAYRQMGFAAREKIRHNFDVKRVSLPRYLALLQALCQ